MSLLEEVSKLEEQLIGIRRHLHQHPELSLEEFKTTKFIQEILEEAGIETKVLKGQTGIVGLIKGEREGKTLALRADIDALPILEETELSFKSKNDGVMHACGHDIHTTVLLGTALYLNKNKSKIKGNLKLIFQPAEEGLGGAKIMLNDFDVLNNPKVDNIIALHCWPNIPVGTIGTRKGPFMASTDLLEIKVIGKSGHAAHPHKCVDPIVIASHIITSLQTVVSRGISPNDSAVVTIGKMEAGTASNVIAGEANLYGTIRTLDANMRDHVLEQVKVIAEKTAESMGGVAQVTIGNGTPPLINDANIVDMLDEAVIEALGKEKLVYLEEPSLGGEDFSFYLEEIPGAMFRLGTANEDESSQVALHNSSIIFDERSLVPGVATMSKVALNYLS